MRSRVARTLGSWLLRGALSAWSLGCTQPNFRLKEGGADGDAAIGAQMEQGEVPESSSFAAEASVADARVADIAPNDGTLTQEGGPGVVDAGSDAAPVAQPPEWARDLLGRYAVRLRFYGREGTSNTRVLQEVVALGVIAADPAGALQLELQLCDDRGRVVAAVGAELGTQVLYPELYPVRRFPIRYKDGAWETDKPPSAVGFDDQPIAGCTPGSTRAGLADKPWLSGKPCRCPDDESVPPTSSEDCRVTDPDADDQPGFSVRLSGVFVGVDHVRIKDFSQLVHGSIASDRRHRAQYAIREDYYALSCRGCRGGAQPVVRNCHPSSNPVVFAPITDGSSGEPAWGCSEILRAASEGLLGGEPHVFPSDC